ncbi:MAG TPA: thermonuclease family protein [Beijerinckiaceae bacterium]|nr:thermonuclease family protein [Beijerinckiaceae bacterium]
MQRRRRVGLRALVSESNAPRALAASAFLLALVVGDSVGWAKTPCGMSAPGNALVRSIGQGLEPRLSDGRIVRLPNIEAPSQAGGDPHLAEKARAALAAWLVGRRVELAPTEARPDRWGRTIARLYARAPGGTPSAGRLWVEREIVGAGWARVLPTQAAPLCLSQLLSAEKRARRSVLGLWSDPYYAIVPALDRAALAERQGSGVIVQGRVVSLGQAHSRIYLNFGHERGSDLSLEIPLRKAGRFAAAGRTLSAYVGARVRARGVLAYWFGPQIEIDSPSQIEIIGKPSIPATSK